MFSFHGMVLAVLVTTVLADDHEYRLMSDLMRHYDSRVRPSLNASEHLNVTFGMALAQIIDVDEKNQIITTNCWLNQAWIDYKLRWDPAKYGGVKVMRIPHEAIWKPDILLYNNADVSSYKSSISTNVIVTSDGNVTWLSMMIFRSSCAIEVKYFPFDEQNCTMIFSSWTYDGFQVNLDKVGEDGDISNYIPNSEWTLVKLHAKRKVEYYSCCAEPYPDVTYTIQMCRKPLFYVFNMILPCWLITLVALLGFYVPSDSGEKVTMGITTLLSMTVFLMLVAENMPPTSDVLPLVGLYYGITIAIVSFATAMTVFTLNIHHKGNSGRPVPMLLKKMCFNFLARFLCLNVGERSRLDRLKGRIEPKLERMSSSFDADYDWSMLQQAPSLSHPQTSRRLNGDVETNKDRQPSPISLLNYFCSSIETDIDADDTKETSIYDVMASDVVKHAGLSTTENGGLSTYFGRRVRPASSYSTASITNKKKPAKNHIQHELSAGNSFLHPPTCKKSSHHAASLLNSNKSSYVTSQMMPSPQQPMSEFDRQFLETMRRVRRTIDITEARICEQERRDLIKTEWQEVALVVDRLLLVVFIGMTVGITLSILLRAPHSWDFIFGTGAVDASSRSATGAGSEAVPTTSSPLAAAVTSPARLSSMAMADLNSTA